MIRRVDAPLGVAAQAYLVRVVRQWYASEFDEVPLGIVAPCQLGPPHLDHGLDLVMSTVEHQPGDVELPQPFAQGRRLVWAGAYELIEIYANGTLRAVRADGSVI